MELTLTIIIKKVNNKPYIVYTKEFGEGVYVYVSENETKLSIEGKMNNRINYEFNVNKAEQNMCDGNNKHYQDEDIEEYEIKLVSV